MKLLDRIVQRWRIAKAVPHIPEGGTVLDVGSADGQLFEILGQRISAGLGIDPLLPKPLVCERYRLIPAHFPGEVPKGETFDAITMLAVLEHFPMDVLRRCEQICSEVLRPGGYVIITVPSRHVDIILTVLKALRLVDAETLDEHHGFEVSMIEHFFSESTFKLIHKEKFQLGLNNLLVFQKR
jgi:2-polyprenyl-3-methyl-5-hydroxy-6-metoxy-1,4-benzoquinol methylase